MQWALAYVAFAFAPLQGVDIVAQRFGWPDQVEKLLILALAVGFCVALVLAWYHGERGAQKVSGTEIVILALLLAIGGGLLWRFERVTPTATNPDAAIVATSSQPRSATPALATVFTEPEHVKSTRSSYSQPSAFGRAVGHHPGNQSSSWPGLRSCAGSAPSERCTEQSP